MYNIWTGTEKEMIAQLPLEGKICTCIHYASSYIEPTMVHYRKCGVSVKTAKFGEDFMKKLSKLCTIEGTWGFRSINAAGLFVLLRFNSKRL